MTTFDGRAVWEGSLLVRVIKNSLLYQALAALVSLGARVYPAVAAVGAFIGRMFADSFIGRVWFSDWPGAGALQGSWIGRVLLGLGHGFAVLGRWASPFMNGVWESSLLGRLWRWVAGTFGPALGTSYFAQGLFGWAGDVRLAPAEAAGQVTSPVVYLLGLALGFLPLLPEGATPLLLVAIWGGAGFWLVLKLKERDFTWRASSALLPIAAFLAIAAASTILSADRGNSILNLIIWVSAILLFFLLVNTVRNTRDAAVFLGPILIGACLMFLWSLYQVKNPPLIEEAWTDPTEGEVTRVFAGMKNPNYLAEYMMLFLPPAIALWFQNPRRRFSLTLIIGAMGLTLLLTGSRGGQLAFAIAFALMVAIRFPRWIPVMIVGGLLFLEVAPEKITGRLATAFSPEHTSNKYRINIWIGVGRMLKQYWLLGAGLGAEAFGKVYQAFMLPAARAAHAHNTFLQILAEMGVLGFFAFLWSLLAVIRRTAVVGASKRTSLVIVASAAALLGIQFHGLVEYIWYNPKLLFAFWAIAGLGVGLVLGNREDAAA